MSRLRGWDWSRGRWSGGLHAWPISRPQLRADWLDEREFYVALSWGTPGVDPVWWVEYHHRLSEPAGRVVDWWYARRA